MAAKKPAPSSKPLARRLQSKAGMKCTLDGLERFSRAPAEVPAALVFAKDQASFARGRGRLGADALLWICYPQGGSGVETDLNRDRGWAPVEAAGLRPVSQIALDATWSALRFRPGPPRGRA